MSTQINATQQMSVSKEEISNAIRSFVSRCSIPYRKVPMDVPLLELCYAEAEKRGYTVEGSDALKPFIPGGVTIASSCYAHLNNTAIQVWIALYTACGVYCDDIFQKSTHSVAVFCERFMRGQPQEDRALDAYADIILETSKYFPRATTNLMVTSTLNLINALLLEEQSQDVKVSASADNYPAWNRTMSGASEYYGLAAFPPEIPLKSFIQALPSFMTFILNVNDILSFYKEEVNGESVNQISMVALCRGCSKSHAFHSVIQETVEAHEKILRILAPNTAALDAYRSFASGYVEFHTGWSSRYRLDELDFKPFLA